MVKLAAWRDIMIMCPDAAQHLCGGEDRLRTLHRCHHRLGCLCQCTKYNTSIQTQGAYTIKQHEAGSRAVSHGGRGEVGLQIAAPRTGWLVILLCTKPGRGPWYSNPERARSADECLDRCTSQFPSVEKKKHFWVLNDRRNPFLTCKMYI